MHGFTGGVETFLNEENKYLHEYLSENINQNCAFASFCYNTRLLDFSIIRRVAGNIPRLNKYLSPSTNQRLDRNADLLRTYYNTLKNKYKTINFICHSMGGLLIKQFIIEERQNRSLHPGFYITLGTPHQGSIGASLLSVSGNTQLKEMEPFSERIDKLEQDWNVISAGINVKFYSALDDSIVHEKSSYVRGQECNRSTVEGSHTSMCKPTTKESALIRSLDLTICNYLQLVKNSPIQSSDLYDYVLFQSYRHECEPYYLTRSADEAVLHALGNGNVWITGPSGSGKTVLAQHALVESGGLYFYIDLSPCSMADNNYGFFQLIFETIQSICNSKDLYCAKIINRPNAPETIIQDISNLLNSISCKMPIYVCVDEVSLLANKVFINLSTQLLSLVIFHNNRLDKTNKVRFIIASGTLPRENFEISAKNKFDSLFKSIHIGNWLDSDIKALMLIASSALAIKLNTDHIDNLLAFSKGSPRRLKNCLSKFMQLQKNSLATIDEAIIKASSEEIL